MRPSSRSDGRTSDASVRAAAANIRSVTRRAWQATTPSPTPGKMYELLPWPDTKVLPSRWQGGKGLPLAKMALPPDQRYASSALHSDREVGLESAKTMGRSF